MHYHCGTIGDQLPVIGAFLKSRPPPSQKKAICYLPFAYSCKIASSSRKRRNYGVTKKNWCNHGDSKTMKIGRIVHPSCLAERSLDRRRIIHEHLATQTSGQRVTSGRKKFCYSFSDVANARIFQVTKRHRLKS